MRSRILSLLATLALAACGAGGRPGLGGNIERSLGRGEAYAARLALAGHAGTPDDASTIALGYLERLRLGLGSPFRLVDYALHDPRLGDDVRRPLAWALLNRTLDGQGYRVDPAALDRLGTSEAGFRPGTGRYHLRLIEDAVRAAGDPRAGELAVRLAYTLSAADGSVWSRAPRLVAQAAALARDRALARADALRLLQTARRQGVDALDLLVRWRAERRFQVEEPRLQSLPLVTESEALALAPRLAASVRALGPRLADLARPGAAPERGSTPLLGPAAAARLAVLADSADGPPTTPLAVALGIFAPDLRSAAGVSDEERVERLRLLQEGRDEERFAALLDRLLDRGGDGDPALAGARLAVASALRSYAQDQVWFPGFGGPTTRELAERFGVQVSFDRGVPEAWRPFYRRMLEQALSDLERVLPAPDFQGLRVRFGRTPLGSQVLALHEPERRILYLPPTTGAGTIAHELAHDLDWQVARRRYEVRGDYASDLATRGARDRLASSLSGLSSASLLAPARASGPANHQRRPAEVFARNMEWFVAVALARDGIMDGYLSSVQDDMLTGYGSVASPDLTGTAGRALVDILDEVAPVYPDTRAWYLRAYGPGRALSAYELLRRVLDPPATADAVRMGAGTLAAVLRADSGQATAAYPSLAALGFEAVQRAQRSGLQAIDAWVCAAPGAIYDRNVEAQRRELVALAAAARARGIATRLAGRVAGRAGRQWMERRLYGAPWPDVALDPATVAALSPLVDAARAASFADLSRPTDGFELTHPADRCDASGLEGYVGATRDDGRARATMDVLATVLERAGDSAVVFTGDH